MTAVKMEQSVERSRFFVLPELNGGRRCSASLTEVKQRQG